MKQISQILLTSAKQDWLLSKLFYVDMLEVKQATLNSQQLTKQGQICQCWQVYV